MKQYTGLSKPEENMASAGVPALGASTGFAAVDGAVLLGYGSLVLAALMAGVFIGRRNHSSRRVQVTHCDPELLDLENANDLRISAESMDYLETRFCPVCLAEYIAGTYVCEDCGVDLVEEMDAPESTPRINERLIRIPNVTNVINAQLLRQYLFAYRIPSLLVRNSLADILASDLYVFESDALRARKIIRQFMAETTRLKPT